MATVSDGANEVVSLLLFGFGLIGVGQMLTRRRHGRPLVSFVIPVRNDAGHLQECLASIRADTYPADRVEIVVANNGSTDETPSVAHSAGARVLFLPGLRVAEIRNVAAREARGEVLAFVDADHQIGPGWTRSAVESLRMPGVAAVGAPYHAPQDGTWVQRMYDAFRDHRDEPRNVEWLGGGNLAVNRDNFMDVGGFDASLVTCEDVDLCQRLRTKGGRILQEPRMRTTHFGDPETLKALFLGELWRGRDNLRASLRTPLTWRGLPSVVVPVAQLALMALALLGLLTAGRGGLSFAGLAMLTLAGVAGLRAAMMLRRMNTVTMKHALQALAVAMVYDVARALALVYHGTHVTRQRSAVR